MKTFILIACMVGAISATSLCNSFMCDLAVAKSMFPGANVCQSVQSTAATGDYYLKYKSRMCGPGSKCTELQDNYRPSRLDTTVIVTHYCVSKSRRNLFDSGSGIAGSQCFMDTDCSGGVCKDNKCVAAAVGVACTSDKQCTGGNYCYKDNTRGTYTCRAYAAAGGSCINSLKCGPMLYCTHAKGSTAGANTCVARNSLAIGTNPTTTVLTSASSDVCKSGNLGNGLCSVPYRYKIITTGNCLSTTTSTTSVETKAFVTGSADKCCKVRTTTDYTTGSFGTSCPMAPGFGGFRSCGSVGSNIDYTAIITAFNAMTDMAKCTDVESLSGTSDDGLKKLSQCYRVMNKTTDKLLGAWAGIYINETKGVKYLKATTDFPCMMMLSNDKPPNVLQQFESFKAYINATTDCSAITVVASMASAALAAILLF